MHRTEHCVIAVIDKKSDHCSEGHFAVPVLSLCVGEGLCTSEMELTSAHPERVTWTL